MDTSAPEYILEWACKRVKKDGVWQPYSSASIFNMYAFSTTPQWSTNNADWHNAFTLGDIYIRYSSDGGKTWTDGARAIGETGKDGPYTDFEFAVGESDIQAPASGWADAPTAVPEGQYLWMRTQYIVPPATVNPNAWSYSRLTGTTGSTGAVGIIPCGHWQSANTPYKKTSLVTMHNATFVALVDTAKPPVWLLKWGSGPTDYLINSTGGYTPLANVENNRNTEWLMITPPPVNGSDGNDGNDSTSYWLTSPVSTININSVGSLSPSAVLISCKKKKGEGAVTACSDFYLAARRYNGSWLDHVLATKASTLSLPAVAGYTQFAVRAYNSAAEANAWGSGFVSEIGVGVVVDGPAGNDGPAGSFPRELGVFVAGTSYVWNPSYRDSILYPFDGVYYKFHVANFGATVTKAPTSAFGDGLWESMGKYRSIATDTLFADGANVARFMFKNGVLRSQDETDGVPNLELDGKTGKFKGIDVELSGKIEAKENSKIAGMEVIGNSLRGVQAIMGIYKHQISGNGSVADRDIIVNNILQQQTYIFSITSASNDVQVRLPSHRDMIQKGIEQYQFEITIVLDNGSTGSAILFRCNDDALIVHGIKSFSTYGLGKGGVLKLLYFQNRYYLVSNSYAQTSPW